MSGTDLVGLVAQQEHMRQVAGSYDGFQQNPGLAASLVTAGVGGQDLSSIGGFVKGLALSQRVTLARQSGVLLDLSNEDRGLLAAVGSHYDDVDKAQQEKIFQAGRGGTLGTLADWANNVASVPGIKQGFAGLNRVADIANVAYRSGALGGHMDYGAIAESSRTMQERGYSPDLLGTMAFYSRGAQQFHNLDDLRKSYSPDMVDEAKQYIVDPEGFMGAGNDAETLTRRDKLLQDPHFKSLVDEVNGRHISPGRDLARGLSLRPGTAPFNVVSGSADALYSWFADPTILLGKTSQAVKAYRYGLGSLSDTGRIDDLMRGNAAVRNGWQQMLDAAKVMRTGTKDEGAAAYAKIRAQTPDLMPVLDEINGGGLREHKPINTYEDLITHVTGTSALVRLANGMAVKEAPLMPGALSRYGYSAVKGALAAAGTRHGNQVIDLTEAAGKFLTGSGDGVDVTGVDVSGLGKIADPTNAEAVGQAAAEWRRSARGRAATLWNRMTTLLPEHSTIDLRGPQGAEDVRRFAAMYMPRAHANALAGKYAVASLAERRAIAEAVYEQVMHAAGLPGSTSGRAWLDAERSKRALEDNSAYDASGKNLDRIEGVDGEAARRNALYFGQTSTHFLLPNVVMMRRLAAKVSIYDHVMRSGMESATLDKAMGFVRTGWLLNPASAGRQAIEAQLAAAATGVSPAELARSRAGLSTISARRASSHLTDMASREVDAEFRPVAGSFRGVFLGKIATNIRRAEAFVGRKAASEEILKRAGELHDADIAGELNGLHAITGFGTRAAHQSIDDAKELLDQGYKVSKLGFRRAGWELGSADGLGGAQHWANEFGRRFNGQPKTGGEFDHLNPYVSEAPHVLRAALEDTGLLRNPRIRDVREWWKAQGHSVPTNEGRVSVTAKKAYVAAHKPREELVNYLLSDEYAQARAIMERFAVLRDGTKVGDDPELLKRAAHELAYDQVQDMKALITGRDGKVHPDLAAQLQRGHFRGREASSSDPEAEIGGSAPSNAAGGGPGPVPSVSFLHRLGPDARPESVIQPKYVPNLDGPGGMRGNLVQALSRGYEYAVHRPLQWMASTPIFQAHYVRAYRNIEPAIKHAFPDMTPEFQQEAVREAAMQHAMAATVKLIDNPRVQTQMSLITRNVFNFWRAQEDFARRWGRILKENPAALRKAQLIVEGGMHTGLVYQNEQGDLVFAYPGSGYAIQAVGKALGVFGLGKFQGLGTVPNLTTKLQFLNSGLDRPFVPATSPVASLPLRVLKHFTGDQVGMLQGVQIAEGSIGAGRSWWAQFLPSPVYRVMASQSKDEREGQYASAARNAMMNLAAVGQIPPADASPDDQQAFKDKIRTGVRNQLLSRALLALVLPGAPSNPTEETDNSSPNGLEKNAFNTVTLQGEYHAMINKYGPQKALAVWTAAHPHDLVYTVATTEGGGYIAPTQQVLGWLAANPKLVQQYPSLAAYFAPNGPGDFSQDAWQTELELGLRAHKNLDTFYRDVAVKGAETTYFNARDKRDAYVAAALARGDTTEVKRVQDMFSAWSSDLQSANPLLIEKWQASDLNKARMAQLTTEVERFANSGVGKQFDANGDLPKLVAAYNSKKAWDDSHKGRTNADQAAKSSVDHAYKDYVGRLLGRSPYLLPLYRGVYDKVS